MLVFFDRFMVIPMLAVDLGFGQGDLLLVGEHFR